MFGVPISGLPGKVSGGKLALGVLGLYQLARWLS
jgi:hypothetical protein